MKIKSRLAAGLITAIILGAFVACIDTSPHWNDTGISVVLILIAAFVSGLISSGWPVLIALAVGIWVPLFNIISAHNYGSLLALAPAFVGAFAGYFSRKIFVVQTRSEKH